MAHLSNNYVQSYEEEQKALFNVALKMFEDGVSYKIIKRYTGIDFSYS